VPASTSVPDAFGGKAAGFGVGVTLGFVGVALAFVAAALAFVGAPDGVVEATLLVAGLGTPNDDAGLGSCDAGAAGRLGPLGLATLS
jgi:hypothetical protein